MLVTRPAALPRQPQVVDSGDMQVLANGKVVLRLKQKKGDRIPVDWPMEADFAEALALELLRAAAAVQQGGH